MHNTLAHTRFGLQITMDEFLAWCGYPPQRARVLTAEMQAVRSALSGLARTASATLRRTSTVECNESRVQLQSMLQ